MNSIFLQITIFLIVLFVYVHITSQLKTTNSLEIYEAETLTTTQLTELCNIRQPCVFYFDISRSTNAINNLGISKTDMLNIYIPNDNIKSSPLQIKSEYLNINQITKSCSSHFSCYNSSLFLNNSELENSFKSQDSFLKPIGHIYTIRDLLIGGNNGTTPFKYDINNRTFLTAYTTSFRIQLSPPSSVNELSPQYDYDLFEFKSNINPWSSNETDAVIKSKISTHIIEVCPGQTVYIPPYWWYSIQFNNTLSHIGYIGYHTAVSALSVSPYLIMRCFQMQNTRYLPCYKNIVNNNNSNNSINKTFKKNINSTNNLVKSDDT